MTHAAPLATNYSVKLIGYGRACYVKHTVHLWVYLTEDGKTYLIQMRRGDATENMFEYIRDFIAEGRMIQVSQSHLPYKFLEVRDAALSQIKRCVNIALISTETRFIWGAGYDLFD